MPWRNDNNIGNSYSNIFNGLEDRIEFAHIYCRVGMPQNSLCHKYFQINEGDLVENILKKKPLGTAFELDDALNTPMEKFSNAYNKMRVMRWEAFFLARNILWDLADWKTERLDKFVEEFKPDIIFGTLTYMPNINKMMVYLNEKYNIPLFIYAWDDVYSLKQYSWSLFYWIRRIAQRKWIKKTVNHSLKMYVIDEMMRKEYNQYFHKDCDILYKGYNYDEGFQGKKVDEVVRFIFMGNLGARRWVALAKLADILKSYNEEKENVSLDIYSLSPISEEMRKKLEIKGTSRIRDVVPNERVMDTMRSADVLIHVEPLTKKDMLFYRLSFSTKLVDYFKAGRCILGFGGKTASLEYLEKTEAGVVVYDMKKLPAIVEKLIINPDLIEAYGKKAWECGVKNHQISIIQNKLMEDFKSLC